MKLSFNTWAYGSFPSWLPAYPLEETIKRLARIGYDGVEIGAWTPHAFPQTTTQERRKEIRRILEGEGIALSSMLPNPPNVSSPVPEERRYAIEHYKDTATLCADLGGSVLLYIPGWVVFGTTRKDAWQWSVNALREIGEYCTQYGMTVVIEPTSFDSNLVDTADHAVEMMEEVELPNVKLMFDTIHVLYRREVLSDYVYRMGSDLKHIHISEERRLPPGQGRGDFPGLVEALKEIGYTGYVTMEIGFAGRDVEPDLFARQAYEYMKPLVS